MAIRKGNFGLQNFTRLMELQTRKIGIFEHMGLLNEMDTVFLDSTGSLFERVTDGEDEILAKARGGDRNFAGRENARSEYFSSAFFPLDGKVTAQDIQDLRLLGTEQEPENAANRVKRLVARIQRSHSVQLQKAMLYAIVNNKTYFPGMTGQEKDYSTIWGAARKQVPNTAFDLSDPAVDPFETLNKEGRRHIIDNAQDDAEGYEVMFACSSDVFDGLIAHPKFEASYSQYASEQEPLRQRISGNRNNRVFKHKGVIVVEIINSAAGSLGSTKGYLYPLGVSDFVKLAYSPADTMKLANTVAEESYMFLKEDDRYTTVESETSFVIVLTRPELIVEFTATLS